MENNAIKFLNHFGWFTPEMMSNRDFLLFIQKANKTLFDIYVISEPMSNNPTLLPTRKQSGLSNSRSSTSIPSDTLRTELPRNFVDNIGWFYGNDPSKVLITSYDSLVRRIEKGILVVPGSLDFYSDRFIAGYLQINITPNIRAEAENILYEFSPIQGICYGLIDLYNIQYLQKEDLIHLCEIHGWTPHCTIDPEQLNRHIINYLRLNPFSTDHDFIQMSIFLL